MRLLVIHLSDIHISSESDPILSRGNKIVEAVRNLDFEAGAVLLVASGDIAQSGHPDQYELARHFFESLQYDIEHSLPDSYKRRVTLVVSPGNHDCLFPEDTGARDLVLGVVMKDPDQLTKKSVIDTCTDVHRPFFDFRDAAACAYLDAGSSLFYEYNILVDNETLLVRCYNTACTSRIKEKPGELVYPVEHVTNSQAIEDAELVISLLHHPSNWFTPENARAISNRVDMTSDLVLTGHEHVQSRRLLTKATGEATQYVEGGVLQERGKWNTSAFNAFVIDTTDRRWKNWHFQWRDNMYRPERSARPDWEPFVINPRRNTKQFMLSKDAERWLDDPGVNLTHRDRGRLQLSDIYTYPDLHISRHGSSRNTQSVRSDDVVDHIYSSGHVLITGGERAGKTSLGKRLCTDLRDKGCVPVFVDGTSLRGAIGDVLHKIAETAFVKWYGEDELEEYRQLETGRRLLVIDDFHRAGYSKEKLAPFLRDISQYAGHVVLLGSDGDPLAFELARHEAEDESGHKFLQHSILELGYRVRGVMIDKWFSLTSHPLAPEEYAQRVAEVEAIADTVLVKGVVPVYPVYLLAVLQAHETAAPMDLRASTHGVLYETFIKAALYADGTGTDYDIKAGYLAYLAYSLFDAQRESLDEAQLAGFHQDYQQRYDMPHVKQRKLGDELIARSILVYNGEAVWFKYKYMYYYFVAAYMRDHISEEKIRKQVQTLAKTVYIEEHANIMLFLAHLSRDPLIIEAMLGSAKDLLSALPEARLEDDVAFLKSESSSVPTPTYIERGIQVARRERAEHLDKLEEDGHGHHDSTMPAKGAQPSVNGQQALDVFGELNAAFKTLQILGQILKNFPGTLEAAPKTAIATACYSLGLRALTQLLELIRQGKDKFLEDMLRLLRRDFPQHTTQKLQDRARQTLYGLTYSIVHATIKNIARAVGSPDLAATYANVLRAMPSPAVTVIDAAISLDQVHFNDASVVRTYTELESSSLARLILQYLVVEHLYLFPVDRDSRERVCAKLKIPVLQQELVRRTYKKIKG